MDKKKRFQKTGIMLFVALAAVSAQETIDESALFADTSSTIDSAKLVNTEASKKSAEEKKTAGFSGTVNAYALPALSRTWFEKPRRDSVGFSSHIIANGLFDARLAGGAKAFADLELDYSPFAAWNPLQTGDHMKPDTGARFFLREMFVDQNIGKTVYLRAGKQVLQWGPCFLWNPTDLVNVDRKTFFQRMGDREGTYGLKIHIPYKTLFNFYSFIDADSATQLDRLAAVAKAEVLLGRTEMAMSLWGKKGKDPVFGFDFSTRLLTLQIAGEAALRNGKDMNTLDLNDTVIAAIGDKWIPRASINLMRFFPLGGVADRLMVSTEFYYNQAGYEPNIFGGGLVDYARIMATLIGKGYGLQEVLGLYEPNSYSKFYGMLSTSISRFFLDDMTFACNIIGNFNQDCFMVSTGVDYRSLHDFLFSLYLNGFIGPDNTEYTFAGSGLAIQIRMGILF